MKKNKSYNFELLYNLSLKGIYLYLYKNKIKYHKYVVDISLMNNQFSIIYNDKQYDRWILIFEKYKRKNYDRYNKNKGRKLIILPTKYFWFLKYIIFRVSTNMLRLRSFIKHPDRLRVHRKSHQHHFHYAYEFSTQIPAYWLDSLVRVSRWVV